MIFVTISAVASTAIANGTLFTAVERIVFVSIGIMVALTGNRVLFSKKN